MKSADEILTETGVYAVHGEWRTPVHDADKLRRFEAGLNRMILREGFEDDDLVSELRHLLSEAILNLEVEETWRLL